MKKLAADYAGQLAHSVGNDCAALRGVGLEELHGGVERFQQRQTAHVADENRSAGREGSIEDPVEDAQKIVDAGKVLDHRRQHHRVVAAGFQPIEVIRPAARELLG